MSVLAAVAWGYAAVTPPTFRPFWVNLPVVTVFAAATFLDEQPLVVIIPNLWKGDPVPQWNKSLTTCSMMRGNNPRVWWRNKLDYSYPAVDCLSVSEEHMECRNLQGWRHRPLFPKVMTFRQISTIRGVQHRCTLLSQWFSGKLYTLNERKLILEIYTPIFH